MSDTNVSRITDKSELDPAQAADVGGGLDLCSADSLVALTGSLTSAYENLVDFASHVIGRVAGEP